MGSELRPTGIEGLGALQWGSHFCVFYQTKTDLLDILLPYFQAGLENNEFCTWMADTPLDVEEAWRALRAAIPLLGQYVAKGQIEILPHMDWYLSAGKFEMDRVLGAWIEKHEQARARGFAGVRCTGNIFCLDREHWSSFAEFESRLHAAFAKLRIIGLCTYALDRVSAADVMDMLHQHHFAVARRNGKWETIQGSGLERAPELLLAILRRTQGGAVAGWEPLSVREREVISMVAEGRTNKDIAKRLSISVRTVERHRSAIMKKLRLKNQAELVSFAVRQGIVGR